MIVVDAIRVLNSLRNKVRNVLSYYLLRRNCEVRRHLGILSELAWAEGKNEAFYHK